MKALLAIAASFAALLPARAALAQDDEIRLGIGPRLAAVKVGAFGGEATEVGLGVSGSVGFGISDALELGGQVSYVTRRSASLDGAVMDEIGGEGFFLEADLHDVEVTASARLIGDVWLSPKLVRLHPYVGARVGGAYRVLSAPQLFLSDGLRPVGMQASQSEFLPVFGLEAGAVYRLSAKLEVGGGVSWSSSGSDRHLLLFGLDVGFQL